MTMVFNLKRSALCCAIAMTAPGMTFAADSQMVVTAAPAETADAPTRGYTATSSTGASKTDLPLITTGQSVSVVTRQQIDDQAANTVGQALNYTLGCFPTSAAVPPGLIPLPCVASMAAMSIICSLMVCV